MINTLIVNKESCLRLLVLVFLSVTVNAVAFNNDSKIRINLDGYWKFEIGDNPDWADPSYDDSNWEDIVVPSTWEDEGFPGYDGFAWYRVNFTISSNYSDMTLYLHLGWIDDVDEVYLNGHFIGYSGSLPPNYMTNYNQRRTYTISNDFLNFSGENVLAIRVYDGGGLGGIIWGDNHISGYYEKLVPEVNLAGIWKFNKGDQSEWKMDDYDDQKWQNVVVPAFWCAYGLKLYDGFGWYRKKFTVPSNLIEKRLIVLLGEIDDLDETYINGQLIGHVGNMNDDPARIVINHNNRWTLRAYYIPGSILNSEGDNIIAVRVYDGMTYGGIYDGPIGIITRERYLNWKNKKEPKRSLFDLIFDVN